MLVGSCHCGAVVVELDTQLAPGELPVRLCGCTFCLEHDPRYTSDPQGHVTIRLASAHAARRHRFGLGLADFLICASCGVFVAAYEPGEPGRAVINARVLAAAGELVATPTRFTAYDSEDAATRTARRAKNWTPATLRIGRESP
ncbi:MAG: aldehyde-activating protein [Kofleriaceae bacterium]